MSTTTLDPATCFRHFAELLDSVAALPSSTSSSFRCCCWFETATSAHIDPSFMNTDATVAFVAGTEQGSNVVVSIKDKEKQDNSSATDSNNSKHKVAYAVAVEEVTNAMTTRSIMLREDFAVCAVSHADALFKQQLMKKKMSKTVTEDDDDDDDQQPLQQKHQVSLVRLFAAPNNYQAWNWRKERFLKLISSSSSACSSSSSFDSFFALWCSEMQSSALVFSRLAKSPESWAHRTWLMKKLFERADDTKMKLVIDVVVSESQRFAARACAVYRRGYPAWEYRRAVWEMVVAMMPMFDHRSSSSPSSLSDVAAAAATTEVDHHLDWLAHNPGDATCSATVVQLLRSLRSSSPQLCQVAETGIHRGWLLTQRMLRLHARVAPSSSSSSLRSDDIVQASFLVPNLSHEAIWLLRRGLVDLSRTEASSLHRGWTLADEIEFVSTLAESHELAVKLWEQQQGGSDTAASEEIVCRMTVVGQDVIAADHGEFAALHAYRYLIWLLR